MQPNAFEVLGLPVRYTLTHTDIEQAFYARIVSAHPDLSGSGSLIDPSALNEARRILLDDESRARAYLDVRAPGAQAPPLSPDFLAEVLDVREQAQEAVETGDAARIARWRSWADEQRRSLSEAFATLMADHEDTVPREVARQAAGVLQRWRYVERMLEQVGVPAHAPDA